jgi:hypothetical protein
MGLDLLSDLFASSADLRKHLIYALLVDNAHCVGGYAKTHPALLAFHPESMIMEIRQESPLGLIVGMRNVATCKRPFAGYLTYFGHGAPPAMRKNPKGSVRKTIKFTGASAAEQGRFTQDSSSRQKLISIKNNWLESLEKYLFVNISDKIQYTVAAS